MLQETIELLDPRPGGVFVDATVGAGGHAAAILGAIGTGGRLIAIDRDADALEVARAHGVRAVTLQADLAQPEQAGGLVERAVAALADVDLLVNSAAVFEPVGPLETTLETWQRHLAIDLTAPFLLSQAFARHRRDRPGVIVNLLDWRALRPGPDHFPYTIAKAGLAAMTRSLAQGLAPNIRVNGLALGAILPPEGEEQRAQAAIQAVPAGRWGRVEESLHALLFLLAGPDFVTGEILHLDGGRHLT
jgi:pteridine reductase